jgi:hypothetical protein
MNVSQSNVPTVANIKIYLSEIKGRIVDDKSATQHAKRFQGFEMDNQAIPNLRPSKKDPPISSLKEKKQGTPKKSSEDRPRRGQSNSPKKQKKRND